MLRSQFVCVCRVIAGNSLAIALCAFSFVASAAALSVYPDKRLNQLITTCLACHSAENVRLEPAYPVPKIGQQHADYIVVALKAYKSGERSNALMRAQAASLTERDMQELADYFSDDGGARGVLVPAENRPAKLIEVCGACHGETGLGNMPGYPVLSGQYEDYLLHALNDYRNGNRKHPFMANFAKPLTAAEMKQLAEYFSRRGTLRIAIAPVDRAKQSIRMIDIPAGEFVMGTESEKDFNIGRPAHRVEIKPFRMGMVPVTFDQYDAFAAETGRAKPSDEGWGRGSRPVINVTWKDTQDFITWLNHETGRGFRLPSEAEREYAARAGTSTNFWWGDEMNQDYVNAVGIKARDQWPFTAPVGQFPANAFGLHDMSGNVWERTADCWHGSYVGAPEDGRPWLGEGCKEHVIRGGYWDIPRLGHFSRYRAIAADEFGSNGLGFRLAEDR